MIAKRRPSSSSRRPRSTDAIKRICKTWSERSWPEAEAEGKTSFCGRHASIPWLSEGELHSKHKEIERGLGWAIEISQPGKYASRPSFFYRDKHPTGGGDFVVLVTQDKVEGSHKFKSWQKYPVAHHEVFRDFKDKMEQNPQFVINALAPALAAVTARGDCPLQAAAKLPPRKNLPGLQPEAFLVTSQLISIAEHRRFAHLEAKLGTGRLLATRMILGMCEGWWSEEDIEKAQKSGYFGLARLVEAANINPYDETALLDKYLALYQRL